MFSPSVSSTMTAGAKAPRGAVPSPGPGAGEPGPDSGATRFSAVSTPLPREVALSGARRSMVAYNSSPSSVGACTTSPPSPKATTPILASPGRRSTRVFAASLAASILVGSTSSAAMLDDTSIASTTVPSMRGTGSVSCGRAEARARRATAIRKMIGGTWRRLPANAAGPSPIAPIVPSLAASLPRLSCSRTYKKTHSGSASSETRTHGQMKDTAVTPAARPAAPCRAARRIAEWPARGPPL